MTDWYKMGDGLEVVVEASRIMSMLRSFSVENLQQKLAGEIDGG
jgi:hypothetical protein